MLENKKIILGITGSIAAYKSAFLTRLLVKAGAEVKVMMTDFATEFITPLTLSTLSKNPVWTDFVKDKTGQWNNHVELALWADAFLIAPSTAHTIGKCAHGICDNLLLAVYLSAKCPVFFAPAMDLDMYKHPSTLDNLNKLSSFGNHILPAAYGELASGLTGEGRMAEPEAIVEFLENFFRSEKAFSGKKVLITAGPTQEAIDPVRYISNHSSGKMGYAIARRFAEQGAEVVLISGPTSLHISHSRIRTVDVKSASEMYEASLQFFHESDVAVLSAAVADYKPTQVAAQKIKKKEGQDKMTLELSKTVDIAKELGKIKKENQLLVGFALETENEVENAIKKLKSKNFDLIVLNSLNDSGAGFGSDTNKVSLIDKWGDQQDYPLKSKEAVAGDVVVKVNEMLNRKKSQKL